MEIECETRLLPKTLTIPLRNLWRDSHDTINLGDSRVVAWENLSSETRGMIKTTTESEYDFVLETPSRDEEGPRKTLDRALTVFKLFKDSLVLSTCVFSRDGIVDAPPHYTHYLDEHRGLKEYHLSNDEETEFVKFWNEFIELPPGDFAVYRFHLADYRVYSRDRLTDYVESLEYLLVPDSGKGEIAYKLKSRGCMIFGTEKDAKEREHIWKTLEELYDLRSGIVHGDTNEEKKLVPDGKWEDRLQPARQYDREAIKFFFRAGCLNNNIKRLELLKRKLIFEAKTV